MIKLDHRGSELITMRWYVRRGICGLVYAKRVRTNPPVVVRGEDAVDLRDEIVRVSVRYPGRPADRARSLGLSVVSPNGQRSIASITGRWVP